MKRVISLLASIILLLSSSPVLADNTKTNPEKAGEAIALINAVTETDFFDGDCEERTTRADFVTITGKVMEAVVSASHEKVFLDVADNAPYSPYVYWALESGCVSEGDLFRPDDVIAINEAVKICVSAMGQTEFAEKKGGYPDGYRAIAAQTGLLDKLQNAGVMTKNNTAIMLYNMLIGELLTPEVVSGNKIQYKYADKTLLYEIHKIKIAEGIITETKLTSFDKNHSYNRNNNSVAVSGVRYRCDINIDDYFGMNCIVFCKDTDGDESIVGIYPKNNVFVEFDLEDVKDFDGDHLTVYNKNGGQKKYKVKASYAEVYNGKVVSPNRGHVTDLTGTAKLLDNDRDGIYDVLFIDHYTYSRVRNVNIAERIIEDKHSSDNNISIDDDNVFFTVQDSRGNALKVTDISKDDILAVLSSDDGTIARITVLANPISSKIETVDGDGNIVINGTEHRISEYALKYCDSRFKSGTEIEAYVNSNGEIAYAFFVDEQYTYGYLTKLYQDEGEDCFIKVFSSAGEFRDYKFADKLMLDGVKKTNDKVYSLLDAGFTDQLIRYKLNKSELVVSIDTAEKCVVDDSLTLAKWEAEKNEDNSLTQYDFGKSSYMFRQNYCFGTSFNAVGATVFMLPAQAGNQYAVDVSDKDNFEMLDVTKIQTGFAYSYFDVYDVDEFGTASVLVSRSVKTSGSPYSFKSGLGLKSSAGMISSVKQAINSDGEYGLNVEIWCNGAFKEYFISEDVECVMVSDSTLQKGDIVRFRAKGAEITDIILDFDYDRFSGNYSYNSSSAQFNKGNTALTYQVGKLYNYNDKFCLYSNIKTGGQYDFAPVNLNNSQVNTNNICCYDADTGTIQTITVNELRSGKVYGNDADYILIKQDGLITQCIFVYRNGGI